MNADAATAAVNVDPALEGEIDAICASSVFRHSPQQQRFLRHLVAKLRSAELGDLREMTLGIEVFRRHPGAFDPKKDPIVRVEARRLRERLARYYAFEGDAASIEVALPIGRYVPVIRARRPQPAPEASSPASASALEQRAWYLMRTRVIEGYRGALDLFTRATVEFADSASAYRGCAWARICIVGHEGLPPESSVQRELIAAAIERAAFLQPTHPHLLILKGGYVARFEHDLAAAYDLHQAGLVGAEGMSSMRTSMGWWYLLSGRFDEAEQTFQRAFALDPFGFWHRHNLASLAYVRRRYAAAEELLVEALEIEPDHALMQLLLARVHIRNGQSAEAVAETESCMRLLPGMPGPELWRVAALAGARDLVAARTAMHAFDASATAENASPVWRAMAYTAIGNLDRAFDCVVQAVQRCDYWLPNVAVDPAFDALRAHQRFTRAMSAASVPFVG
ncbi:MAG: tetratricopeptide repeat protein [Casimicrobiaceae bacterium]